MTVFDVDGGVEVIPANVDLIGFLDEPCDSGISLLSLIGRKRRWELTIEGETWMFHDLEDEASPLRSSRAVRNCISGMIDR